MCVFVELILEKISNSAIRDITSRMQHLLRCQPEIQRKPGMAIAAPRIASDAFWLLVAQTEG
jgi:hypothetical protein